MSRPNQQTQFIYTAPILSSFPNQCIEHVIEKPSQLTSQDAHLKKLNQVKK